MEIQIDFKELIAKYGREVVIYTLFHYRILLESNWLSSQDKSLYSKVLECLNDIKSLLANVKFNSIGDLRLTSFAGELITNTEKLEIIKNAKQNYYDFQSLGMCITFREAIDKFVEQKTNLISFAFLPIDQIIQEFRQDNPKLKVTKPSGAFWWNTDNKTSRINAYDYLISVYENKISKEIE